MKNSKTSTPTSIPKSAQGSTVQRTDSQRTSRAKAQLLDFSQVKERATELSDKFVCSRTSLGLGVSSSRLFNLTTPRTLFTTGATSKITKVESQYSVKSNLEAAQPKVHSSAVPFSRISSQTCKNAVNLPNKQTNSQPENRRAKVQSTDAIVETKKRQQFTSQNKLKTSPSSSQFQLSNKSQNKVRKSTAAQKGLSKIGSVSSIFQRKINLQPDDTSLQSPKQTSQTIKDFDSENLLYPQILKNLTPPKQQIRSHKPQRSITGLMFTQRISPQCNNRLPVGDLVHLDQKVQNFPKERSSTQNVLGQKDSMKRKRKQPQQLRKQNSQPQLLKTVALATDGLQQQSNNSTEPAKVKFVGQQNIELNSKRQLNTYRSEKTLFQPCKLGPKSTLEKPIQLQMTSSIISIAEKDTQLEDNLDWLPLHQACINGDSQLVEDLIRKYKHSVDKISNGFAAIHIACQLKNRQVLERLLLARARVDILTKNSDTILHLLAQQPNFSKDQWDLLIPFCQEILHFRNKQGLTAHEMLTSSQKQQLEIHTQQVHVPMVTQRKAPKNFVRLSPEYEVGPKKPLQSSVKLQKQTNLSLEPNPYTTKAFQPSVEIDQLQLVYPKKQPSPQKLQIATVKQLISPKSKQNQEKGPEDFIAHQLLGTGSFGEVFLIERKTDKKLLAMKVLLKKRVRDQNLQKYALTERNVMSGMGSHPFIVQLLYAFQTIDKLFLVSDYAAGGDLSQYLEIEGKFSEQKAKLYLAEITLALEALHAQNIIYRDLKPDNVVVSQDGHIMLTDFGLSREGVKRSDQGAKSFCGSYAYLAPEMVRKTGHGKTVDWYLLGVILFEMITGMPPYYADDKNELFSNILTKELKLDDKTLNLSEECKDLLQQLLEKDPLQRLGRNGSEEVKAHQFFKQTDWKQVYQKGLAMPEAYLAEMALNIIKQQPYLVAGHPSTVGKPCPQEHPAYLKIWTFTFQPK